MLIKNHLQLLEKINKRREGIANTYRVNDIDADSFFCNFLDVFTQNNRIILFSQRFYCATISIKKFKNDDYITKQSFDLSTKLHINKYEMLFILKTVPEIMEKYRNKSQSNYIPIPEPVTIISSRHSALLFHYYKDYIAEGVGVRIAIQLPNIYIQKFSSKFGTLPGIDLKFNEK